MRSRAAKRAEQPADRVFYVVVGSERPEGGFVGWIGVALAGWERDGEIVDRSHDGDRGLEVGAVGRA